ncbi:MAG: glycerol kinase GlpK [Proteobacteria bacterium]|nr:glycerol kinase GlpK [Pseudomonadota bacterium]
MSEQPYILAIDQGTTSSRAILFDRAGRPVAVDQREFTQHYPGDGWVEHDPEEIWQTTVTVIKGALAAAGAEAGDVSAIGITNQRETTVVWERDTGSAIHNAIVWQDRRTARTCAALVEDGHGAMVQSKTGLIVDAYFSATKIAWILDHVTGARARGRRGELAFGTIDSFLLWRLTGGRSHATDATNASRTMLFDIHRQVWDDDLLALFAVPRELLPEVRDSSADFGVTESDLLGVSIPITGIAGDQQAAAFGQACFTPGMIKSTFGTGCFALVNTGGQAVASTNRLLTTVAYRLDGVPAYALEGSIFVAGAAVKWLRDTVGLIASAEQTEALVREAAPQSGVYLVPAFVGLGAPYWDPDARAALLGMTLDTGRAEIVRATLESVAYQMRDLMDAMRADGAASPVALRVDGGMAVNGWLMQFLADILDAPVERPLITETTALGAAFLAGLHTGFYPSLEALAGQWRRDALFTPSMDEGERAQRYAGWRAAVARVRTSADGRLVE